MDLKYDSSVYWVRLAHDRNNWRDVVSTPTIKCRDLLDQASNEGRFVLRSADCAVNHTANFIPLLGRVFQQCIAPRCTVFVTNTPSIVFLLLSFFL
jgi:hypothetical protein